MSPTAQERTDAELNRLFRIYRHADLNVRYYGCRAEMFESRIRKLNVWSAFFSALALGLLIGDVTYAKYCAVVLTGIVGVAMAVSPLSGWTEKARDCRNLHFAYKQLFAQAELVIAEIRRNEEVTEEQMGAAKMVHESFMRLDAIDEPEPDPNLIERENKKVLKAYPDDYVWTNF